MDIKTANEIVQKKWKDMEVVPGKRSYSSNPSVHVDNSDNQIVQSPSIEELKKKYLEVDDNISAVVHKTSEDAYPGNDNVTVQLMMAKNNMAQPGKNEERRTVIISKNELIGSQG